MVPYSYDFESQYALERSYEILHVPGRNVDPDLIPNREKAEQEYWEQLQTLSPEALPEEVHDLELELSAAYERHRETARRFLDTTAKAPALETSSEAIRAHRALGACAELDSRLHIAEQAMYSLGTYGRVLDEYADLRERRRTEFHPHVGYDGPMYDPSKAWDRYEQDYVEMPSHEEVQAWQRNAYDSAWDRAKALLEDNRYRDFAAFRKMLEAEDKTLKEEGDHVHDQIMENIQEWGNHKDGRDFLTEKGKCVLDKQQDRLRNLQNTWSLLNYRGMTILQSSWAVGHVLRRHLAGLEVPSSDNLTEEQSARLRTKNAGVGTSWGRARSATQENVVYALEIIEARQEAGRPLSGLGELGVELKETRSADCLKAVQKAVGYAELPSEEQSLSRLHSLLVTHVEAARLDDPTYYGAKQSQAKAEVRKKYGLDRSNG